MSLTVKMTKDRETKGTVVYSEDEDQSGIRSLYITKDKAADLGDKVTVVVKDRS